MPVPGVLTDVHAALTSLPVGVLFTVTLLAVALETSLFVGLLVPGDVIVLVVATSAVTPARFGAVAVAAVVGSLFGESVGYAIGRRFGPGLRGSRLGRRLGEWRWQKATETVGRWGPRAVVLARFTPVIHAMFPVVAATLRYPYRRFAGWCAVAAAAWAVVYTGLGAVAGSQLTRVKSVPGLLGVVALLAFGLVCVGMVGRGQRRHLVADHGACVPPRGAVAPAAPAEATRSMSTGSMSAGSRSRRSTSQAFAAVATTRVDVGTSVETGTEGPRTDGLRADGGGAGRSEGDGTRAEGIPDDGRCPDQRDGGAVMVRTGTAVGVEEGVSTRSVVEVAARHVASTSLDVSRGEPGMRAASPLPTATTRQAATATAPTRAAPSTSAATTRVRLAWQGRHVLVLAAVTVLVGFLAYQNRDAIDPRTWRDSLHLGWVTLAVVGVAATLVGNAWNLMGASPVRLRFGPTVAVQVAGSLLRVVSPAAVGNAAVNVQHLRRVGLGDAAAVGTVSVAQAVQLVLTVVLLPPIAFAAGANVTLLGGDGVRIALYSGVVVAALAGAAFLVLRRSPRLRDRASALVGELTRSLRAMVADPRRGLVSLAGAVLISAGLAISLWASVHAFGGSLSPLTAFGVLLLGSTAGNAVPVPGGLGSVEAALVAALTATGTALTVALPAVALFRLVTLWFLLPAGLVSVGILRRRGQL
jgi:membrane protein DedA with SNARE-associated domain/uncharacterized membrane protein YbhN (UPF0104 family)